MESNEYVVMMLKRHLVRLFEDPETRYKSYDAGELLALIAKLEVIASLGEEALGDEAETKP